MAKRMRILIAMSAMSLIVSTWSAAQAPQPPTQQCIVVDPQCNFPLPEGCSCQKEKDIVGPPPLPAPPECDPKVILQQLKDLTGTIKFLLLPPTCQLTKDQCESMLGRHVARLADGTLVCAPNKCSKMCFKFGSSGGVTHGGDNSILEFCSACISMPIDPRHSVDPNDKNGPLGVSAVQFVAADVPLSYSIHFENLRTANAPAQVVAVTDQLDLATMDLDTFRLGPISFGDNSLVPAPGVTGWTGGVDFRPAQNLIVAIAARLDKSNGLVTWRFTSIDPDTGELTDDPDAGFLPPNTAPPSGEGSVVFTVMPKSGLATGTAIRNQASVVFDTNAPLATPTWLNTIDRDAPVTHVLPLTATQTSPTFTVRWTGTDAGSGIGGFTVFVSDNGGPFKIWLDSTPLSSGSYVGEAGHTYGFFSAGADLVGNVEALKTAAEATTQVGTQATCASNVSSQVQVTRSGFGYNLATQRFTQTVTIKNASAGAITGPLSLVLDNLSSNATLFGPSGTTACAVPAGSPFANASVNLNPGASVSVALQFANPSRAGITYSTRVLAGSAGR